MFTIDAYYVENIKPLIKSEILDYLDMGHAECPQFEDLCIDAQEELAGLLFFNDKDNFDPIADLDVKFLIKRMMTTTNKETVNDLRDLVTDKITNYYKDTITEILYFEFKEINDDYQDGLCETYTYD